MLRIESMRIGRLHHVAFTVDDYGDYSDFSWGFTRSHAERRCLRYHDRRMGW